MQQYEPLWTAPQFQHVDTGAAIFGLVVLALALVLIAFNDEPSVPEDEKDWW